MPTWTMIIHKEFVLWTRVIPILRVSSYWIFDVLLYWYSCDHGENPLRNVPVQSTFARHHQSGTNETISEI